MLNNLKILKGNDLHLTYVSWMTIKTQVNHKDEILNRMKTSQRLLKDEQWTKNRRKYIKLDLTLNMKSIQENTVRINFKLKKKNFLKFWRILSLQFLIKTNHQLMLLKNGKIWNFQIQNGERLIFFIKMQSNFLLNHQKTKTKKINWS